MANERLADLSPADVYEIAQRDPRVQLMERLYSTPEARADLETVVRKNAKLFPNAQLPPDITQIAKDAVAEDRQALADLRKELAEERKAARLKGFHAEMIEAGADPEDCEKIDAFMLDNDLGPKAVKVAVEKYYDSLPAEPSATGPFTWDNPTGADQEIVKALTNASPDADLYQIAAPHFERVFTDMTKGQRNKVLTK